MRFYQTRFHAIALSNTLPAICTEKVVFMKTREELYCKRCQSARLARVTIVPNSHHVQKDVLVSKLRKSDDRENEVHKHRETCGSGRVDFRLLAFHIPLLNKLKQSEMKKFDD